jgi:hypothetical protein
MTLAATSSDEAILATAFAPHERDSSLPPALLALDLGNRDWTRWLSALISVALICLIGWSLRDIGFVSAVHLLPAKPLFWLCFSAYYFALPFADWLIFRWLWNLPSGGFAALLRKLVSNELLFSYSGEAWFYAWCRRHGQIIASPFGAIKDVSILSALAGNLMTLAMLALAWPLLGTLPPQFHGQAAFGSGAVIVAMSMVIFFLKHWIFTLPGEQLRGIFAVHAVRLVATTFLSGAMWHLALPGISLVWLVLLATGQLLVTRLPLVPNKDLVFASLAIALIGHAVPITAVIGMIATCLLAMHILAGAVLILPPLLRGQNT